MMQLGNNEEYGTSNNNNNNKNGGGLRGRKLESWYSIGRCCNYSSEYEWILITGLDDDDPCEWQRIAPGACAGGRDTDCEGMTCGGGFYKIPGIFGGQCVTPGRDSWPFTGYRWLPPDNACGDAGADGPSDRCGDDFTSLPPGYPWGPRPGKTCPPTPVPVVVTSAPLPTSSSVEEQQHSEVVPEVVPVHVRVPEIVETRSDWEYISMTPPNDAKLSHVP